MSAKGRGTNHGVEMISSTDLIGYLQQTGWRREYRREGVFETWLRTWGPQGEGAALLIPLDPTYTDYGTRMKVALTSVAAATSTSIDRLVLDLLLSNSDEITATRDTPTVAGSVPWNEGEAQFAGLKAVYAAAAKAAEEPARYYGNRRWNTAKAALSGLRMGQTQLGSYVVTAFSPKGPVLREQSAGTGPDLWLTGRLVTETLFSSLSVLREAVHWYRHHLEVEVFDETVRDGVSYELVKGVTAMLAGAAEMRLGVTWSPSDGAQRRKGESVPFTTDDASALDVAQKHLYVDPAAGLVTILGTVTNLDRDHPGEPGVVELDVIRGADARRVHVRIQDDYDVAIRAHRGEGLVQARGRLEKEGQTFWLYDVSLFIIVDTPEHRDVARRAPGSRDIPLF